MVFLKDDKKHAKELKTVCKSYQQNTLSKVTCNPYSAKKFLSCKCCLLFTSAVYMQMHFRLLLIRNVNTKGAVLCGSILFSK